MSEAANGGAMRVGGIAISALVAAVLIADGATGLLAPQVLAEPMAKTGFPAAMLGVVGIAAMAAGLLYAIPRTAVLGAILVTAFCGGAVATHVRIGDVVAPEQILCTLLGVGAWAGLYLRDPRLRALLPLRR